MLLFHDEMFECIATGHKSEVLHESLATALEIPTKRLLGRS